MGREKNSLVRKISIFSEREIENAYFFFRYKYPKLIILCLSIILAYIVFSDPSFSSYVSGLQKFGYVGVFFAGIFFSFGFSSPFAIGYFLTVQPPSILIAFLVGGFGSLIADIFFFKIIKSSFIDEFENLKKEKPIREMNYL